jgi:hypothetical protein
VAPLRHLPMSAMRPLLGVKRTSHVALVALDLSKIAWLAAIGSSATSTSRMRARCRRERSEGHRKLRPRRPSKLSRGPGSALKSARAVRVGRRGADQASKNQACGCSSPRAIARSRRWVKRISMRSSCSRLYGSRASASLTALGGAHRHKCSRLLAAGDGAAGNGAAASWPGREIGGRGRAASPDNMRMSLASAARRSSSVAVGLMQRNHCAGVVMAIDIFGPPDVGRKRS